MKASSTFVPDNPLISPMYRVSDWQCANANDNWPLMICIFKDRLSGRFLNPIRLLEKDATIGPFAGFSILALDCLLIETLNQFYQGLNETPGDHQKQFWLFFKGSEFFKQHFTRKSAEIFYSHIRCGLLHQAQTKKQTFIRADQLTMVQASNGNLSNGIIVDRAKFHQALELEVASYLDKLELGGEANSNLRENFLKKMQIICSEFSGFSAN